MTDYGKYLRRTAKTLLECAEAMENVQCINAQQADMISQRDAAIRSKDAVIEALRAEIRSQAREAKNASFAAG